MLIRLLTGALVCTLLAGCSQQAPHPEASTQQQTASADSEWFVERAHQSGINFQLFNGMSGEYYLPEIKSGGVGMLDFDNDGDLDVFFVQGVMLGIDKTLDDALLPLPSGIPLHDCLFRNDQVSAHDGATEAKFVDVTSSSGIDEHEYGIGVAVGDYDNDGWIDLYVTSITSNRLWHNNGDGTFTDMTALANAGDERYSTSAAFFDFDRDGWLDLYIVNYVNFAMNTVRICRSPSGRPDYCAPLSYDALPDRLLHNRGDGTFEDVSVATRIVTKYGNGLGVVTADFNSDGWIDIYIANDQMPNFLWMNQHDGTFEESALLAGCAVSGDGSAEASMGVDAGDYDNDGDEDVFMTHLVGEANRLYVNDGTGWFSDRSAVSGVARPSRNFTSFGSAFFDFDNDGLLDIFVASGAVSSLPELESRGDPFPYGQTNQLFKNAGDGGFLDVTDRAGRVFEDLGVSRGAAFGDLDNDGDTDIVVTNINGPAQLLINQIGSANRWIGIRVLTRDGVRDALGARITVSGENLLTRSRRARSDASYSTSNDPRVLIGLNQSSEKVNVTVQWPDGNSEQWTGLEIDQYVTLTQGTGHSF